MAKYSAPVYGGSGMDGLFCGSIGNSDPFNGVHGAPGSKRGVIRVKGAGGDIRRNPFGPIALIGYVLCNSCAALSLAVTKALTQWVISSSVVAHEQILIRITVFPFQRVPPTQHSPDVWIYRRV